MNTFCKSPNRINSSIVTLREPLALLSEATQSPTLSHLGPCTPSHPGFVFNCTLPAVDGQSEPLLNAS